jgi:hypothetical protein
MRNETPCACGPGARAPLRAQAGESKSGGAEGGSGMKMIGVKASFEHAVAVYDADAVSSGLSLKSLQS